MGGPGPCPQLCSWGWIPRVLTLLTALGLCSRKEAESSCPTAGPWSQRTGLGVGVRAVGIPCARPRGDTLWCSVPLSSFPKDKLAFLRS